MKIRALSRVKTLVQSTNKWLLVITGICCLFVLTDLPFLGIGKQAESLLTNVSYNIIAAFVFYVVFDVLPRARATRALLPYVTRQIYLLENDVHAICKEAARIKGVTLPDKWSLSHDAQLNSYFEGLSTNEPANMQDPNGQKLTFNDYLYFHAERSKKWLANLSSLGSFLGGEGLALIGNLQEDTFLQISSQLIVLARAKPIALTALGPDVQEHDALVAALRDWAIGNGLCDAQLLRTN